MKSSTVALLLILVAGSVAWADDLEAELVALEKGLWEARATGNDEPFREHLTEDHVQVVAGTGIVVGREAIAAMVSNHPCKLESFDFDNVKVRRLARSVVVLTYKATQEAYCGRTKLPRWIYSTSIFVRQQGRWLSASYQETPID